MSPIYMLYIFIKKRYLEFALTFCIICAIILLFIKVTLVFSYHPDISGSERSTIFGIQLVAAGMPVYGDPERPPFWMIQYSPSYFYLVGLIYRFLGWDPTNAHKVYFLSRFISMILVFMSLFMAFKTLICTCKLNYKASIIACLFLMGLLQYWHLTNSRIDSLLFFLTVLFIYFTLKAFEHAKTSNNWLLLAISVAAFAFFTKQSGIIHFVTLSAYLLWRRDFRTFFLSLGIWIFVLSILALFFMYPTFSISIDNMFGGLRLPLSWAWFYHYTFIELFTITSSFVGVSLLIALKWVITSDDKKKLFLGLAMFVFFGFSFATSFKFGAGVGYFHEFAYTGILSICLEFFSNRKIVYKGIWVTGLSCLSLLYFTAHQVNFFYTTDYKLLENDYSDQRIVKEYISQRINPGEVVVILSNDDRQRGLLLQHMLFRHIIAIQDDLTHFTQKNKTFNFKRFFAMAKTKQIKYLILSRQATPYFFAFNYTFNLSDYKLEKELRGFFIYVHK